MDELKDLRCQIRAIAEGIARDANKICKIIDRDGETTIFNVYGELQQVRELNRLVVEYETLRHYLQK